MLRIQIQNELIKTLKPSVDVRCDSKLCLPESVKENYEYLKNKSEINETIYK